MRKAIILVIEANGSLLRLMMRFLEEHVAAGTTVIGVDDATAVVSALAEEISPRLIIVELDGDTPAALSLISVLRATLPAVVIVAISRLAVVEYRDAALQAGANRLLEKLTLHRTLPELLGEYGL